jgi:uncharacterized repeat protein (TIGR01451 family)
MSRIENQAFIDIESCEEMLTLESNEEQVTKVELEIVKTAGCRYTIAGGTIRWCTKIKNNSGIDVEDITFRDILAQGTSYVADSFTVNGAPATPTYIADMRKLTYHIAEIEEGEEITICFRAHVS